MFRGSPGRPSTNRPGVIFFGRGLGGVRKEGKGSARGRCLRGLVAHHSSAKRQVKIVASPNVLLPASTSGTTVNPTSGEIGS